MEPYVCFKKAESDFEFTLNMQNSKELRKKKEEISQSNKNDILTKSYQNNIILKVRLTMINLILSFAY